MHQAREHIQYTEQQQWLVESVLEKKGTRDSKYAPPPPLELCPAPFLGLPVQPCGEPCGSAAGFYFLTVEIMWIEQKNSACSAWVCASGW
jgi:hypothetical protein